MLFNDLRKGLAVTIKYLFTKPVTCQYPNERLEVPERGRWLHALETFEDSGKIKCIDCGLCERVCPSKCIKITPVENEDHTKNAAEYEIDLGRCLFCGLCVEVCPELALSMTDKYELAEYDREKFIYTKEQLLNSKSKEG
ncbi:NuoI/complex I 23 kDa subunit family protein [Hippea sp. KM1]|uniref:NuoI/complex I 23 kDa subunit family protein n=1 Tax=Hippea sp. KM1 TaxID=944481 RepID=UPI00046CAA22|nr:NADH-quinone oxidoreductase subunit I [Hippea sp. KM1]